MSINACISCFLLPFRSLQDWGVRIQWVVKLSKSLSGRRTGGTELQALRSRYRKTSTKTTCPYKVMCAFTVFPPENFTWGPKWPLKIFLGANFLGRGSINLKLQKGKMHKGTIILNTIILSNSWLERTSHFFQQVLSDILVDRINYRVMSDVYADIPGGWTMKQKIREQVRTCV